jgi:hypothetical protein
MLRRDNSTQEGILNPPKRASPRGNNTQLRRCTENILWSLRGCKNRNYKEPVVLRLRGKTTLLDTRYTRPEHFLQHNSRERRVAEDIEDLGT